MTNTSIKLADMRCAVLGGGGFIGTNLCRALVNKVKSLRAFGRRQLFPEALLGCEWIQGDFADPTSLSAAISGCDVVFHLVNATTPQTANTNKIADLNANVVNTLHLLEACRETGVQRVIFASSGGTIYGIPKQIPTPETAPTDPITAYGISKLAIEKYLNLYEYLYGLEHCILRISNPFGPYQLAQKSQGVIAAFMHRALLGKPLEIWGDGNIIRDYIYIDDVIEALLLASTYGGMGRVFNIGSGEGRNLTNIIGEMNDLFKFGVQLEYRQGRPVDVPVSILNTEFALNELGWQKHTTFRQGLENTLAWMRSGQSISI